MTSPDTLLAAILADPANNDLRLVYADLLDDRGEGERAEFIRVQAELASLPQPYPRYKVRRIERTPRQNIDFKSYNLVCEGWYLTAEIDAKDAVKYPPPKPGDGVDFYNAIEGGGACEWINNRVQDFEIQLDNGVLIVRAEQGKIPDAHRIKRDALRRRERELWPNALFSILDEVREMRLIPDAMIVYKDDERLNHTTNKSEAYVSRGFIAEVRLSCDDWLAHGPALVRRQPIQEVVLTDKKPVTHTPGLWRWAHDEPNFRHTGHSSLLPGELFDLLDGQPPGHWHFDSESSAIDALSAAALLWAR